MVQLLIGHKGSGKTNKMIQLANESIKTCDGSIIVRITSVNIHFLPLNVNLAKA